MGIKLWIGWMAAVLAADSLFAGTVLFTDDMSGGAGWQYSHFGGTGKPGPTDISRAEFGFDYSVFGIPEAPNHQLGDPSTTGLQLKVNTPGVWGGDQVAVVYEDVEFAGQYTVQVDVWLNWASGAGSSGTTEHAGVLAGFQVEDAQGGFSPGQNGAGVLFDTDGDSSCNVNVCDYMLVKDGARLDLASGQYGESDFGTGNRVGYNDSDSNANLDLQALFPAFDIASATGGLNGAGTQPAGALGFQWVTVTLAVDAEAAGVGLGDALGTVEVTLESERHGTSFVLGVVDNSVEDDPNDGKDTGERPVNMEGGIGLMLTDLFNSGPSDPSRAFALFDNVRVSSGIPVRPVASGLVEVPEPATGWMILLALLLGGRMIIWRPGITGVKRASLQMLVVFISCGPGDCGMGGNQAWGILNLTGNFDHGALQSWSGDTSNIQLVGRENHPTTAGWRWLYFQAFGLEDAQTVFSINQAFAGGNNALNNHEMVYSYDNENWFFFDNNHRASNNFTFSNNAPFTQDEVYVAYAQPYSYGRSVAHTEQVLATPWAVPTVSGDVRGVIGQTPIAFDDLGRLNPKRDIFGYRITDPATDSDSIAKRKVMITTGLHSGEVLGTHTFEGLVNWLVSNDSRAARLRETAEFFAYPTLNAAGRFAGTSRATIENPNQDPNGLWDPSKWASHPDIKASGEAMLADVASTPGSVLDAFIDFHSTIPTSLGDDFAFIEFEQGDNQADFWLELRALQPNVLETDSTGSSSTTANFADLLLNAEVDITFETQFGKNRSLDYYHTLGANFGIAFYNAWIQVENPEAADFDEDGDVDQADRNAWQQNFGTSLQAEHYQGDADFDFDTDGNDFLIWQQQLGNGSLSLGTVQAIPEPVTGVLLILGMLPFLCTEVWRTRS